jgi:hypothetical protein
MTQHIFRTAICLIFMHGIPYTDGWSSESMRRPGKLQEPIGSPRREQTRRYRRNQIFGVLLVAGVILLAALLRTNPKWIFTPGWWRP